MNQLEGIGCSEAPRGTLFHHYQVNADGLIQKVNLLIATGQNNLAMNRTVLQVARHYIKGPRIPEGILNRLEAGIRAFDPCLSCSTHAAGQMPLHLQLLGADGRLLDEVRVVDILVIGYGNELRGDDALGPRVVEVIAAANFPGVRCGRSSSLPELAAVLAEAEMVIFVDALANPSRSSVELAPVATEEITDWSTHTADPRTLLALTRAVYGRTPEAWWLMVPGRNFDFGEELSATAEVNMRQAIAGIKRLIQAKTRCRPPAGEKTCTN